MTKRLENEIQSLRKRIESLQKSLRNTNKRNLDLKERVDRIVEILKVKEPIKND